MREIIFRQWLCRRKIMYDGIGAITNSNWAGMPELNFDINPLMQYTGLRDKNGKAIYEGDIVKRPAGYNGDTFEQFCVCCVFWDDGGFALAKNGTAFIATLDSCEVGNRGIEVIGNIYETPELLRGHHGD